MINEVITIIYWLGDWNFINFQTSYSATGNKELKNIKSCNAAISTDSNDTKCDVFSKSKNNLLFVILFLDQIICD